MIKWLLKTIKPVVMFLGKVHMPFSIKRITGEDYYKLRFGIEPGCIILTTTYGEFSNLINPGKTKHAALYIGGGKIKHVIEAVGTGVIKKDLVTFLLSKDEIIVLKPKQYTNEEVEDAIDNAYSYIGQPYDYVFSLDNGAKYCSELIWFSYRQANPDIKLKCDQYSGHHVVRPDHFLEDTANWEVIYRNTGK